MNAKLSVPRQTNAMSSKLRVASANILAGLLPDSIRACKVRHKFLRLIRDELL